MGQMSDLHSVSGICPACGGSRMRLLSAPNPEYVEQCLACRSTFFNFGSGDTLSHNAQYQGEAEYQDYLDAANEPSLLQRHGQTIDRLRELLSDVRSPKLFDVGAGGGDFLARALESGFVVAGNEISKPAIAICRERNGIELAAGDDLEAIAVESGDFDAVTMWCVIAHVDDPRQLLKGTKALLRPGGVLFFSTPRYCVIDRVAVILCRLSGDRYRRMFDRRINAAHRRQYSRRGMESLLKSEGFIPVGVAPAIGYGLHMVAYLRSMGFPDVIARPLGKGLELLANAGLAPRNILNVYARAA